MSDGFHWTRVTSKQLRFLYENVTLLPAPQHMYELVARLDGRGPAQPTDGSQNAAVRNNPPAEDVNAGKEHQP
jgi:hypothetical protein